MQLLKLLFPLLGEFRNAMLSLPVFNLFDLLQRQRRVLFDFFHLLFLVPHQCAVTILVRCACGIKNSCVHAATCDKSGPRDRAAVAAGALARVQPVAK